jgi:dolichyl-phosphate beta-glucosyltransferase
MDESSFLPPSVRSTFIYVLKSISSITFSDLYNFFFYAILLFLVFILFFGIFIPLVKAIFVLRTPDGPYEDIFDDPNKLVKGNGGSNLLNDPMYGVGEFYSIFQEAIISLSVVVPAYNEDVRLPKMLDEAIYHLDSKSRRDPSFSYEIIVVDDGSRDSTCKVVLSYSKIYGTNKIRLLRLHQNHGKGGAVRKGCMKSRGEMILMADADGATQFSDVDRLLTQIRVLNDYGVCIGSRHHMQADAVAKRSHLRNFLMYGFNFYVSTLCVPGIKDTQCGFKLFTRKAARALFPVQHIERWAFDVELLHLCSRLSIPVTEVPVTWTEMSGSKVNLFEDIPQMARDILIIRLCYTCRIWSTQYDGVARYNSRKAKLN